jgi:hypothetical protein
MSNTIQSVGPDVGRHRRGNASCLDGVDEDGEPGIIWWWSDYEFGENKNGGTGLMCLLCDRGHAFRVDPLSSTGFCELTATTVSTIPDLVESLARARAGLRALSHFQQTKPDGAHPGPKGRESRTPRTSPCITVCSRDRGVGPSSCSWTLASRRRMVGGRPCPRWRRTSCVCQICRSARGKAVRDRSGSGAFRAPSSYLRPSLAPRHPLTARVASQEPPQDSTAAGSPGSAALGQWVRPCLRAPVRARSA